MDIGRKIAQKLANTKFGINAVQEKADLSVFKQRPSFRVLMGIILMVISYIIGLPVISMLGVIAYKYDLPLLFFAGAPALYVISHLVFLLGMYLAGANYAKVFFRWAVRRMIEKYG
ncbi:MAG: hypothetical protein JRJ27_01685 [Deltaproteobacteria bacterium]|nr:hypothetical protein [Deltaproteobacteria bacterium]